MAKILSENEWLNWDKDFFWMKHSALVSEDKQENEAYRDIILKWAGLNCKGWVTFMEGYWMFHYKADASKVKSAIITGFFDGDMGEIKDE